MNKVRLILTSVISIMLVSILMIGSTYSIFTTSDVDEELNVYTTGNLDITYTVSSEEVTLSDSLPTNIADANTIVPYCITVTNKGTVPYMFDLSLEDITSSDVIDDQYIMTKVGSLEPKPLSSCTNNIIKEDIILPAGESVDIDVRVWISDEIQNTELNKSFFAKLKVTGVAIYDKNEEIDNSILSLRYMKSLFSTDNDYTYFRSDTYRSKIKKVSFVDYIDTSNKVESWDVSEKGDGSVVVWVTNNETEGYYDLYIGSDKTIFSKELSYFFADLTNVDSIDFSNLDTSLTTNMYKMFLKTGYNSTIFALDLGKNFDTSNVTDMEAMFYETGYTNKNFTLNLGEKFDTSNVINMSNMFNGIGYNSRIFELDLGNFFYTNNVIVMEWMFHRVGYYNSEFILNLGNNFDTSNVTNMIGMFFAVGHDSEKLILDLGENFDTSKVTSMTNMFNEIGYKTSQFSINLGDNFDTSNVTMMNSMFKYAGFENSNFILDLGEKFDTSNVVNMTYMFYNTGWSNNNLGLDLSTFSFDKVTSYNEMFHGFSTTKKIYVKDEADQTWILEKGFSNLSTSNVLVKS